MRRGVLAMVLIVILLAGCFNGENGHQASEPGWVTPGDSDVEALIEERLLDQLPPPPEPAIQTLHEVKLHRRRVAGQMLERAESALAPLAFTAALLRSTAPWICCSMWSRSASWAGPSSGAERPCARARPAS